MQTITTSVPQCQNNLIREDELHLHLQDETKVNAIRNGKLTQVYWNELTADERRAANLVMFSLCEWEVSA